MDELYAIEKGSIDVLSISKVKSGGINSKGFSHGLENEIAKDMLRKREAVVSLDESSNDEPITGKTNMEMSIGVNPAKNAEEGIVFDNIKCIKVPSSDDESFLEFNLKEDDRSIKFIVNDTLNRLVIDDGIAPTSFSFDIGLNQELVRMYDSDELCDLTKALFTYMISLKHPTAIYEYNDFINRDFWKFGSVSKDTYDYEKYVFFTVNGYVLCYNIDKDSVQNFYDFIEKMEYEPNDILRIYVSMAYAVGTMNQAFFGEDETYIKALMKSSYNKQKEFHNLFSNDESTILIPNNQDITSEDGIIMYDLQESQTYVRDVIGKITGTSYFDDDEDDEDYEEENEVTEYEETESNEEEDDSVSELFSEDMENVENSESVEESAENKEQPSSNEEYSDDDFIVDVVRKK